MSLGDSCTSCDFTSCNSEYCACYDDADCGTVATCIKACAANDTSCDYGCFVGHTTGISEAAVLEDCASRQCATGCNVTLELTSCESCMFTMAMSDVDACLTTSDCAAYFLCLTSCGSDPTCPSTCGASPTTPEQNILNDFDGPCGNVCGQ